MERKGAQFVRARRATETSWKRKTNKQTSQPNGTPTLLIYKDHFIFLSAALLWQQSRTEENSTITCLGLCLRNWRRKPNEERASLHSLAANCSALCLVNSPSDFIDFSICQRAQRWKKRCHLSRLLLFSRLRDASRARSKERRPIPRPEHRTRLSLRKRRGEEEEERERGLANYNN